MKQHADSENLSLATEMLKELKVISRRWFIAFIVVLSLWFTTIGAFIWYISLPTEEVTLENEDGNANYIGNDLNGVINNGENNTQEKSGKK